MAKRLEYKGRFVAKDTAGNEIGINKYVEIIGAGTMQDPDATIEGLKSLKTDDGNDVNRLAKGKYQIVQSGIELVSEADNAP